MYVSTSKVLFVFHGCAHIKNATCIPWMCQHQDCLLYSMDVSTSRLLLVFHGCVHIKIAFCIPWMCPYQDCYLYSMDVSTLRLLIFFFSEKAIFKYSKKASLNTLQNFLWKHLLWCLLEEFVRSFDSPTLNHKENIITIFWSIGLFLLIH